MASPFELNLSIGWKNKKFRIMITEFFLGEFNFYRSLEDRNKSQGNSTRYSHFHWCDWAAGFGRTPSQRSFTWSNMQQDPLLEQLDWFFTSINWTRYYPNTLVLPLAKIASDHIPALLQATNKNRTLNTNSTTALKLPCQTASESELTLSGSSFWLN